VDSSGLMQSARVPPRFDTSAPGEPRRPVSIEKLDYGKTSIIKSLFLVVVTVCTGKVESKSETEWIARMTAVHVLENWTDEK